MILKPLSFCILNCHSPHTEHREHLLMARKEVSTRLQDKYTDILLEDRAPVDTHQGDMFLANTLMEDKTVVDRATRDTVDPVGLLGQVPREDMEGTSPTLYEHTHLIG